MSEEKIVAVEDERQLQNQGDGGSPLGSEFMVVAADETESVAIADITEIPPAGGNGANELPKDDARQTETSLRGPTGPKTLAGKKKSRVNAIKHGIFAKGIIPSRESEADYLQIVDGLSPSIQPEGILEELLVEKLAMLMWRYRRLLQAEAAEVASQTKNCHDAYHQQKIDAVETAKREKGLINAAMKGSNDLALEAAITALKAIRERVRAQGLDWERDRKELSDVYGAYPKPGEQMTVTLEVVHHGRPYKVLDPKRMMVVRYRELTIARSDTPNPTGLPPDAAESVLRMITEDVDKFESMLQDWRREGDDDNQFEESRRLIPWQEAIDRLQRYEGSLERSFDRTLSQLERLQRMRLGQPVLPEIKVDVSH